MRLLSKKKTAWAQQFKPTNLLGSPLNPNISDAIYYKRSLDKLINKMVDEVNAKLKKLFASETGASYFAQDASIASQTRILLNALTAKYEEMFNTVSKPLAERVVNLADKSSTTALHSSLQELSGGLSLKTSALSGQVKEILQASIEENVNLIKSIPQKYLNEVQGSTMRSITSGRGLADLLPELEKYKQITHRRAKMIAYDQTRKAFNSINRGKMEKLGLQSFKWLHSGGSNHPRREHIELSGKIFRIDSPPIIDKNTGKRGFPGDLVNCRCRMLPVIKFND